MDKIATFMLLMKASDILRKLIDRWNPNKSMPINYRHIIFKSRDLIEATISGNLETINGIFKTNRTMLAPNLVSDFMQRNLRDHIQISEYSSWDQTPVSPLKNSDSCLYEPTLSLDDVIKLCNTYDSISSSFITFCQENIMPLPLTEVCRVKYYEEGCGDGIIRLTEFRPLWLGVLGLENVSNDVVAISNCNGKIFHNRNYDFRPMGDDNGEKARLDIPIMVLCILVWIN